MAGGTKGRLEHQRSRNLIRRSGNVAHEIYIDRRCLLEVAERAKVYTGLDYDLMWRTSKGSQGRKTD